MGEQDRGFHADRIKVSYWDALGNETVKYFAATLPEEEIGALHARQRLELPPARRALAQLKRQVAQTRRRGYANTDDLVADGVSGVGVAFEVTPATYAAISVGAIKSRMREERRRWIAQVMFEELRASGWQPFLPGG
jgi:DNA-binding IclR family transcriptional regulator